MGQHNTRHKSEKSDINPDYQTYARNGEVDYAVDSNGEYQPSDYDEMYDTSRDNSCKVRELRHTRIAKYYMVYWHKR